MPSLFEEQPSTLEELRDKWKGCTKCVFSKMWKETGPCLIESETGTGQILVVGQWPGQEDMQKGIPFSGPLGVKTKKMIENVGFDPIHLTYTNVLLCSCPIVPNPEILDNCRDQIDQTIHILKPKLILSLGNHAAKRFGFRGSMGAIHGTNRAYKTSRVYCCTHPAALYRTETEKARARVELDIETDLKLALHFFKS